MRYEYVRVALDKNNYALNAQLDAHRAVIDDQAAKGMRYAGFIPAKQGPSGKILELDLIFEAQE